MAGRDTIFALATGAGPAAIAVIRVSGPRAFDGLTALTGRAVPAPRQMVLRNIHDAEGGLIDAPLVVVFERNASFTGEDSVELHCHGGRAVVQAVLTRLGQIGGFRGAKAGEFTRRAFESGRLDLIEAQGLADLVAAETELQRRAAVNTVRRAAPVLQAWRADLIRARALLEATIDWADEEVPEDVDPEVAELLGRAQSAIGVELQAFDRSEKLRTGFEVALIGAPNAGKSTLLNAIAGRDVAITSETAGTTRDVIEVRCDIGGVPVRFLDTAGLREASDSIEQQGVRIAVERARAADLRMLIVSPDTEVPQIPDGLLTDGDLRVANKSDLGRLDSEFKVSAVSGDGLDDLLNAIGDRFREGITGHFGHWTQRDALSRCLDLVGEARAGWGSVEPEITGELIRAAVAEVDGLTGRHALEDVLDTVFGQFCLGK